MKYKVLEMNGDFIFGYMKSFKKRKYFWSKSFIEWQTIWILKPDSRRIRALKLSEILHKMALGKEFELLQKDDNERIAAEKDIKIIADDLNSKHFDTLELAIDYVRYMYVPLF